ncbi:hypothetical protein [Blastococcus goldschmidtiae]|uniref:DUF4333 domain-containing protein n=1 Tax=Blastococcus goldschmidtiae TaxID=3075546 RepID=A0ABU2K757_9ACTN|nr:hypothetical protein [Blastococcus sp. DSM 46792]MDT0276023.1 hypothetical protein [Blastococcus sp. DSM 46792]
MTSGPFLYDDDPAPLHTGAPQRSGKWLVLIFGGTVLAAVLVVFLGVLIRGSGSEQATEVTGVFLTALAADDTETAHALLCADERARLEPGEVAGEYLGEGDPELGEVRRDGDVRLVPVRWDDGTTSELTVIGEDGLRVCGTD